jgi:hypothetical protein
VDFLETDGIIFWQTLNLLNYSLDDKPQVNIISSEAFLGPPVNTSNVTISGLDEGQHKLVVTAVFVANVGNAFMPTYTLTSEPVYFTVNTEPQTESFPTTLVLTSVVVVFGVVLAGASFLLYQKH